MKLKLRDLKYLIKESMLPEKFPNPIEVAIGMLALSGAAVGFDSYNRHETAVELSMMDGDEIHQKLKENMPPAFVEQLDREGLDLTDLAVQIDSMSADEISEFLQMEIEYPIDPEDASMGIERINARRAGSDATYRGDLETPMTYPGDYYPPFRYK